MVLNEEEIKQSSPAEDATEETDAYSEPRTYLPDATRLSRLLAQILDGIILMFASMPVMFLLDIGSNLIWEDVVETGIPLGQILQITALGVFLYVLINGYHLWYFGQTLGKKMMGIAIVDAQDKVPAFAKIIGIRYAPFQFAGAIPGVALIGLIDVLLIFRADKRCLHDMAAGTRVADISEHAEKTQA